MGISSKLPKKIFLTKLKGHPNLFVTGVFLYSQYRNKEENTEGTEDLFLNRQIFVKSVFVRTIFDCISKLLTKTSNKKEFCTDQWCMSFGGNTFRG